MFDIGWPEFALIGVVALVAIGPKELPGALRTAGQWVGKARRMAQDFQNQFQEALREADIAEMKKQFDDAASAAQTASGNLIGSVKSDVEDALKVDAADAGGGKAALTEPAPQPLLQNAAEIEHETEVAPSNGVDAKPSEAAPALDSKPS